MLEKFTFPKDESVDPELLKQADVLLEENIENLTLLQKEIQGMFDEEKKLLHKLYVNNKMKKDLMGKMEHLSSFDTTVSKELHEKNDEVSVLLDSVHGNIQEAQEDQDSLNEEMTIAMEKAEKIQKLISEFYEQLFEAGVRSEEKEEVQT